MVAAEFAKSQAEHILQFPSNYIPSKLDSPLVFEEREEIDRGDKSDNDKIVLLIETE